MENFRFIVGSIIAMMVFVLIGYWAVTTMEPGSFHVDKQKQEQLEKENAELAQEVEKLKSEIRLLEEDKEPVTPVTPNPTPTTPTTPAPTKPTTPTPTTTLSKNQTLINELQKLVDDNIQMKVGSKGTRVGTVQNFLNLYNGTSKRVDNDYGKTLKADVMAFQKKEGLTADGEAGPTTFKKMIAWLERQ